MTRELSRQGTKLQWLAVFMAVINALVAVLMPNRLSYMNWVTVGLLVVVIMVVAMVKRLMR